MYIRTYARACAREGEEGSDLIRQRLRRCHLPLKGKAFGETAQAKGKAFGETAQAKGKAFGKDASALRESTIERKLRQELGRMGCLFYKFVSPCNNGVPDRIVITPGGRVVFVELKTERGKLSPVQLRQIKRLEDHRAAVFVVSGEEHIDALLDWIRQREGR